MIGNHVRETDQTYVPAEEKAARVVGWLKSDGMKATIGSYAGVEHKLNQNRGRNVENIGGKQFIN